MAKETTKKFRLPAQGKPKPKVKKTSTKELGSIANKQFKQGYAEKDKKTIPILGPGSTKQTAKEEALLQEKLRKKNIPDRGDDNVLIKERNKMDPRKRKLARITGV